MKISRWFLQLLLVVMCLCANSFSVSGTPSHKVIEYEDWRISYQSEEALFTLEYQFGEKGSYSTVLASSSPEVCYRTSEGVEHHLFASHFKKMKHRCSRLNDTFGRGVSHRFEFRRPENGDDVTMTLEFRMYEGCEYLLTRLSLSTTQNDSISSNYLAPINIRRPYRLLQADPANRMLKVPFDNDSFVRYQKYHLDREMTSYEVTALYEGISRKGLVVGSVEHNRWKSAVKVMAEAGGVIRSLKAFSGISDKETRDVRPHGSPVGREVSSALMFVGYHADWRNGMEQFAHANTLVQPARMTWNRGTPFGWQSWGVMAEKNSFEVDCDVAEYFHHTLQPGGFVNEKGLNIMSIDSWDNLSDPQKRQLTRLCEGYGQVAGTYLTPFCLWWNDDMLHSHKVTEGSPYTGYDCVIKVDGEPIKLDGAFCLDPTHPGTKQKMSADLQRIKEQGFRYVKVDFTSNGMVQADAYHNPKVKTAVEAYNEGFSHFVCEADKGEPLFVALSIAPIFPYQYGNSRRIACDTWGKIGHTEYSMNAVGAGWWTNGFYQYNDPDHLVLVGNDEVKETEGENRARVTNGAVSGMMLVSDNYSAKHRPERGNAQLSFERAKKVLMNHEVNEMAQLGRSFRPVYGYREYNGKADGAEWCVMLRTERYLYVAVFNYGSEELQELVPLERLGITPTNYTYVKELWTGETFSVEANGLECRVPPKDARIYRFE